MKQCTVCNVEKQDSEFESTRRQCRPCRAVQQKIRKARWYAKNKRNAVEYTRVWRLNNPEYRKTTEYIKRAENHKLAAREYRRLNPHKINALSRKYQCARIQRTPAWLGSEDFWLIGEIYELAALRSVITNTQWEVDHVIPLRGKLVSGLHVPSNLQVILKATNAKKKHHYSPA